MVKVEQSTWPVVYMEVDGLATVADMNEYIQAMESLLARNERFGLIMLSGMSDNDYKSFKRDKVAQKLSNDWHKANQGRMGAQCIGIAMVTKANQMMKLMKPVAKLTLSRRMGTSGDLFFSRAEAEAWLATKL